MIMELWQNMEGNQKVIIIFRVVVKVYIISLKNINMEKKVD